MRRMAAYQRSGPGSGFYVPNLDLEDPVACFAHRGFLTYHHCRFVWVGYVVLCLVGIEINTRK